MKKLSLYVFLVLIFSSLVFADSSKVIPSIEKLFKEKVKTIAEGDLFYGCIYFIAYGDEDLFTQKKKLHSVKIGNPKEYAHLLVKDFNDLSKGDVKAPKVGDCFAFMSLKNASVMVQTETSIFATAELYLGDYTVDQKIIQKTLKENLTVDEYFEYGFHYGKKRIKLSGIVDKILTAGDGNLYIDLVSKQGKVVTAMYMKSDWKNNNSIKNHILSIKDGDNIQLKGYFDTEIGDAAFFTIQKIIE